MYTSSLNIYGQRCRGLARCWSSSSCVIYSHRAVVSVSSRRHRHNRYRRIRRPCAKLKSSNSRAGSSGNNNNNNTSISRRLITAINHASYPPIRVRCTTYFTPRTDPEEYARPPFDARIYIIYSAFGKWSSHAAEEILFIINIIIIIIIITILWGRGLAMKFFCEATEFIYFSWPTTTTFTRFARRYRRNVIYDIKPQRSILY
jgi:hypothetical protein